jgi:glycosyltransferase involved in cell wall biosynthesis
MWKDVKSEVPWAELHIYYGWKTLNLFKEKGFSDNGFQERMIKKLKELEPYGVYEHGRIGHHQLLEEFSKSEILAYPCTFGETNCIVLTKAIAMGCYPVTSNYSAVGERNPIKLLPENGLIRDSEGNTNNELFLMYKQELIAALNGKRIQTIDTKTFVQENTWDYIAQKWQNDLFKS